MGTKRIRDGDVENELFWAARFGRVDSLRELLQRGTASTGPTGPTRCSTDPAYGHAALTAAASSDQAEATAVLLDAGAGVNLVAQESGLTPLAAAVIEGATACVRHLLAKGADPELPDTDGFTPLMHAALHGRVDSAAALVEAGAVLGVGPAGVGAKELAHVQGHQALVELIEGGDQKRLEKAAAEKAEAERVVAAKEASERAAVERAAAEKEREAAEKVAEERVAVERAAAAEAAAEKQAAAELAAAAAVPPPIEAAAAAPAASEAAPSEAESGASANLQAGERNTGRRTRCAAPTAGQLAPTRLEVVQEGDDVVVRLHAAEIVRLRSHGELTLSSGGWRTVSTLEAINGSVAELVPVRPATARTHSRQRTRPPLLACGAAPATTARAHRARRHCGRAPARAPPRLPPATRHPPPATRLLVSPRAVLAGAQAGARQVRQWR